MLDSVHSLVSAHMFDIMFGDERVNVVPYSEH